MLATLTAASAESAIAGLDERQLIAQARRDPAALTQLYRLHCAVIHGYVLRRVGNVADADDLTAEVFLSMVRALPRFRWQGAPFRAWLYRLATHEVNRWAHRRRKVAERIISEHPIEQVAARATRESPWDLEYLQAALLSLPPRHQAVLSLSYFEELSIAQIAQVLNCREGTVKSRLSRGRESLRILLERREVKNERTA